MNSETYPWIAFAEGALAGVLHLCLEIGDGLNQIAEVSLLTLRDYQPAVVFVLVAIYFQLMKRDK